MREHGPPDATLSEHERQVLREIEAQLRRDGGLGARISHSSRGARGGWAAVLLVLGGALMLLAALTVSLLAAFAAGLLLAAGFALACVRSARALDGWLRRNAGAAPPR